MTPETPKPDSERRRGRVMDWIDRRTGLRRLLHDSLDEPIPGGPRWAYVFGSGLLFLFVSQVVTGLCLTLYYVPSVDDAHTSVAYITKVVAAGAFLRSLHSYGASAMIIVLALHFLQTFLYGSYKGRRELLWISGALTALLVLGMGFTGYLLPWDQKSYFATAVGTNVIGEVPIIGGWLTRFLRGGDTLGTLTLSRFYVAHVFLLPAGMMLLIAAHLALFRKAGPAGPMTENPVQPTSPPGSFYPWQVLMDMGFALVVIAALGVLAYFHPIGLGPRANPAAANYLPRPDWYYLPLFEWLKLWEGPYVALAVVGVPGLLAAGFFLLPFLDRGLERRPWRRPLPLLAVSIVLAGVLYLGGRSRYDDLHDPSVARQLALQAAEERAYTAAPFKPLMVSPGGNGGGQSAPPVLAAAPGPVSPLVAQGHGVFQNNGCFACHGNLGMGTSRAPSLAGITKKFTGAQITALLHHPNAAMHAGGMPSFQLSSNDMNALLSYLGVIGTTAATVAPTYNAAPQVAAAIAETAPATAAAGMPPLAVSEAVAPAAPATATAAGAASAELATGRRMFQQHACFACHGSSGQGTARAPALPGLIHLLSDQRLAALIRSPNARMRAGGMPAYSGDPASLQALIAYLRSLPVPGLPAGAASSAAATATAPAPAAPPVATPTPGAAPRPTATVAAATPAMPGEHLFLENGCIACHGPRGVGTHFAPSLQKVGKLFTRAQIHALLRNPLPKMRAGGMPAVTIPEAQIQQLISYVISLSTAPPPAPAAPAPVAGAPTAAAAPKPPERPKPLSQAAIAGRHLFQTYSCYACHGVGGLTGTVAAPPLAGTASLLPARVIEDLLLHHSIQMQQGGMPLTDLSPQQAAELAAYIRSLPPNPGH
jgi:ubiquinol-cytochrome c reductase cytochrome b subunit